MMLMKLFLALFLVVAFIPATVPVGGDAGHPENSEKAEHPEVEDEA